MGASEQQAEYQVAQMREALRSIARSRRTSRVVGILAVVVGFGIVGLFLLSFFSIMGGVVDNPEPLQEAFTERIQQLGIERKASQIAKEVGPVVQKEAVALLKELKLPELAMEQAKIMAKDLEPVVRAEFDRVRPRLEGVLADQKEKTAEALRDLLEDKLSGRFVASIEGFSGDLQTKTGLTDESLAQLVEDLQKTCVTALANVIQKRTGDVMTEMEKIFDTLEDVPHWGQERSQDSLLLEMRDVLFAILKDELPDYDIRAIEFERRLRRAPPETFAGPPPPEVLKKIEEDQQRQAAEAARKAAGEGGQ